VANKKFRKKFGKIFDLKLDIRRLRILFYGKYMITSTSMEDISKDKRDIRSITLDSENQP
jgi:hypothetical protein